MKRKFITRTVSLCLGAALLCGASTMLFSACSKISNESTYLTLGSNPLDGVFNPFFYTSGDDGEVVGYTQVGLLSSDDKGQPVAGKDELSVALDFSVVTTGTREDVNGDDYSKFYTDYYFAIKNGLKFSDGHDLTIKDVLFNLYMYLDPAYTGSSTMYSVAIQGLADYRTQTHDKNEQAAFEDYFASEAATRVNAIRAWADDDRSTWNDASLASYGAHVKDDILNAHKLFKDELKTDWNNSQNSVEDYKKYHLTQGWEVFLFSYGHITSTPKKDAEGKIIDYDTEYNIPGDLAHDEDTLIDYVYRGMVGDNESASKSYKSNLYNLVTYYATANTLREDLTSQAISDYYETNGISIHTISGIKPLGKRSSIPYKDAAGALQQRDLGEECEVLQITINGVDPKAIQNFSFTVAPMHYYSSVADQFSLEEGNEHFGVKFADSKFMNEIKVNHVPLGAGPYRASKEGGSSATETITKGQFLKDNIVYLERNDNFMFGPAKIKNLCLKVTSSTMLYEAVRSGELHYAMPSVTQEMKGKLDGADKGKLGYVLTENLGYGYIGINASYVHDIHIRRAIMYAMNNKLIEDYYRSSDLVEMINRPMSKTLKDYYPTDAAARYPFDDSGNKSKEEVALAGYRIENGVLTKGTDKLKFTFTVAGESLDHPAYATLNRAAEILNGIGFEITVTNDSMALAKLASGQLAVWAAAWSSSSDPDMYQVYHKKSNATSVLNWGYPYLMTLGTSEEKKLIDDLSVLIEQGREYTEVADRRPIYFDALDKVMDLAVELPTYQRKNLYVFQKGVLDEATFYPDASAYRSPLTNIWEVSFIESN